MKQIPVRKVIILSSGVKDGDSLKVFSFVYFFKFFETSFILMSYFFDLQEAEWHCDEFTKGACFSRGKSEVSANDV